MADARSEIASRIVAKHRDRQAAEATILAAADRLLAKQPPEARQEFANLLAGQYGAHAGAQTYRLLADWSVTLTDPDDDWKWDAPTMAARAWDLVQNDANARAMLECMTIGVLGECGLSFRSLFQTDPNAATTDADLNFRRTLESIVHLARAGTNVDASATLTSREFDAQMVASMIVSGDAFAVRVWSPRKNAPMGQRWRIVAPERISNPDGKPNTPTLFEGIKLDDNGAPIGLYVRRFHPLSSKNAGEPKWDLVDWTAPDGSANVLHLFKAIRPGQRRGFTWFAPLMVLAQHLSKTVEAFVVAKRTQASLPLIVKTDDPGQTALAAKQGALLGPNTRWRPNLIAYTSANNEVVFPQWQFNGADYKEFIDSCLRSFSACWGLPFQFVLCQLTDANLASAQVALDQADKTFTALQDLFVAKITCPMDEAYLREALARGAFKAPKGIEIPYLCASRYLRPRRPDANKQRTREAAAMFIDLGGSRTTAFAEMGYDFEEETLLRRQNDDFQKKHGVVVTEPDVQDAEKRGQVKTSGK